jgi:hypothetical protein
VEKTSDPSIVKNQDEASILARIAANPYGRRLVFDYLDEKWDYFIERFGSVSFTLPNLVRGAMEQFNTKFEIESINRFVKAHPNTGIATAAFKEALETAQINNQWLVKNLNSLNKWLSDNVKPEPEPVTSSTTKAPVTTSVTGSSTLAPITDYRLPTDVLPLHYDLEMQAFIGPQSEYGEKAFTLNGKMTMLLACSKPTRRILFHAAKLQVAINQVRLKRESDGASQVIESIQYDERREYHIVYLSDDLEQFKNYSLFVPYTGQVLTELYGFYQSSYKENGVTK